MCKLYFILWTFNSFIMYFFDNVFVLLYGTLSVVLVYGKTDFEKG